MSARGAEDGGGELATLLETARGHHKAGRLEEARALYRRVLQADPGNPVAQNLLGVAEHSEGRYREAAALLEAAIRGRPGAASFHNNLANARKELGQLDEAERGYREALRLRPGYGLAHYNLGALLQARGRSDEAAAALEEALRRGFTRPEVHGALSGVRAAQGRFAEAEACCRRALHAEPGSASAHFDLGNLLRQQGRLEEAVAAFQRATRLQPRHPAAWNNLGSLFQMQGRVDAALACVRRALEQDPRSAEAHFNLGSLLEGEKQLEQARDAYERALELGAPFAAQVHLHLAHVRRLLCDWDDEAARHQAVRAEIERHLHSGARRGLPPLTLNLLEVPGRVRLAVARQQAEGLAELAGEARRRLSFTHPREPRPARLRIGYVSPDFRGHAVGTLVHRMFEHHDRERFEVFAYSLVDVDDSFSRAIRAGCDEFRDASKQSPEETARRIHADGVHLLVDLAGYTTYSRTAIAALRPAPVQLHYLGYLDTLGADFLPWMIADATAVTPEMESEYSEAVVRLPECFMAASPLPVAEGSGERGEEGLPEDGLVFCCLNHPHKLDPQSFEVWMRILRRVPGSALWLYGGGTTEGGRANLRREADARGVEPERIVFARKRPLPEYLARYRLADLFLDTFAYNAGATAVGALQVGLPVLTHPGRTFFGRMGASIASAAGLPELVCESPGAYEERAVELASDGRGELRALRERLLAGRATAPLFDLPRSVRHLERAYALVWQEHAEGRPPRPLEVPAGEAAI